MITKIAGSIVRYTIALVVGFFAYFVALFSTVGYTGFEMMICQPFMAAGASMIFVVLAIIIGLPLVLLQPRVRILNSPILTLSILLIGFILFFVSIGNDPANPTMSLEISFQLLVTGYFLIIFSIVNWPETGILKKLMKFYQQRLTK